MARLATVGPDGFPHVVPIVFARLGDRLWSAIDGKPKASGEPARVRDLRTRPRASLLLDDIRRVRSWCASAEAARRFA